MVSRSIYFTFFLLVFSFIFIESVYAQRAPQTGVGIRPATIEEAAQPGESQTHEVTVVNLSGNTQTYYIFARDISGVQPGGVPIFADENAERTGYELTEWLEFDVEEIELAPNEESIVTITINVPENATPGSHFGGMFVSLDPPQLRSVGASVGYEVANIISIRVAGDAIENAQIRSFSTGKYVYGETDIDFMARVENKGTVLVRPIGPLEIFNMFGSRVALITFNENKAGVFPRTIRDFEVAWESEDIGFGRYQAVLSMVYGDQNRQSTISSTLSFWILPMNIILPALGILVLVLLAVYGSIRLYIRRTVNGMAGPRRLVRRRQQNGIPVLLLITIAMLVVTSLFLIILLVLFA